MKNLPEDAPDTVPNFDELLLPEIQYTLQPSQYDSIEFLA